MDRKGDGSLIRLTGSRKILSDMPPHTGVVISDD
jgi:hypothetical protein